MDEDKSSSSYKTNKIFVGGIAKDTTDGAFAAFFSRYGSLQDAKVMRDRQSGNCRGFGFVTFTDSSSVDKVLSSPPVFEGRKLDCKIAVPRDSGGGAPVERIRKMFVGGLTVETTADDLKEHFGQFGTVVNAMIMNDAQSGRSRGFGFVTFDSEDAIDAVLARTHTIHGKTAECKKAVSKQKIVNEARKSGADRGGESFDRYSLMMRAGYGYPMGASPVSYRDYAYAAAAAAAGYREDIYSYLYGLGAGGGAPGGAPGGGSRGSSGRERSYDSSSSSRSSDRERRSGSSSSSSRDRSYRPY
jgi:RNA recognition motif-containing protein